MCNADEKKSDIRISGMCYSNQVMHSQGEYPSIANTPISMSPVRTQDVPYQGPYTLLPPQQTASGGNCGCVVDVPGNTVLSVHVPGPCVAVRCTSSTTMCTLEYDVTSHVYAIRGPGTFAVGYTLLSCDKCGETYFLVNGKAKSSVYHAIIFYDVIHLY